MFNCQFLKSPPKFINYSKWQTDQQKLQVLWLPKESTLTTHPPTKIKIKINSTPRPSPPSPEKPIPQPPAGTYVIQIPKDQIYRLPPPENADRLKRLSRPKSSRTCRCCRFFCFTLLTLILLLAIASGIFYLVFRPESPHYSINSISIKPLNLSSSSSRISPQFNISVTANNPNNHIGIYYEKDSSVEAYYQDLTSSVHKQLVAAEKSGTVALKVNLRAPVKIKVGSVKTWTIKVKINCDLTVDKLTSQSKILSKDCDYGVELW
ncbi:hypothetical protein Patl1_30211 [Pistacia atlantica]|uniref:Uncharacterized protein n=1 Tax=Pistacia atlantica TaxID=434234 RepID=A0ACC1ACD2_9ROSI|nr:hypothetical protein Patl1_30211 [Pistacia atlantica]